VSLAGTRIRLLAPGTGTPAADATASPDAATAD
jgi:hypothetical protein